MSMDETYKAGEGLYETSRGKVDEFAKAVNTAFGQSYQLLSSDLDRYDTKLMRGLVRDAIGALEDSYEVAKVLRDEIHKSMAEIKRRMDQGLDQTRESIEKLHDGEPVSDRIREFRENIGRKMADDSGLLVATAGAGWSQQALFFTLVSGVLYFLYDSVRSDDDAAADANAMRALLSSLFPAWSLGENLLSIFERKGKGEQEIRYYEKIIAFCGGWPLLVVRVQAAIAKEEDQYIVVKDWIKEMNEA